jgi:murein DD-endopeptidase MepM/ murein hydrolase activator NlpD
MKNTILLLTFFFAMLATGLRAQTTSAPVWNLPIGVGNSARVDFDATNGPYHRQILFSETTLGAGLQVVAAAGGTAQNSGELDVAYCSDTNDSFPPCTPSGIIIDHGNGFFTVYAGLDPTSMGNSGIANGDYVSAGQILGSAAPNGSIGLGKLHFEVILPMYGDSIITPPHTIVRNIMTARSRTGTFKYDSQNQTPVFNIGTAQRQVVAGEILSVSTTGRSKTADSSLGNQEIRSTIFPNPANTELNLEMELPSEMSVTFSIRDLRGAVVATPIQGQFFQAGHNRIAMDVSHLPSGLYLYGIQANGVRQSGKVVIAH